jgi:hypothetical protein
VPQYQKISSLNHKTIGAAEENKHNRKTPTIITIKLFSLLNSKNSGRLHQFVRCTSLWQKVGAVMR